MFKCFSLNTVKKNFIIQEYKFDCYIEKKSDCINWKSDRFNQCT